MTLKSATTFVASNATHVWRHDHGDPGLAVSGSGDTLAGIIAGLASRGASAEQAAAWTVFVHGAAGDRLRRRYGPVGYVAREIAGEVPALLAALGPRSSRKWSASECAVERPRARHQRFMPGSVVAHD